MRRVTCNKCGKNYQYDEKLLQKGEKKFDCRNCGHTMILAPGGAMNQDQANGGFLYADQTMDQPLPLFADETIPDKKKFIIPALWAQGSLGLRSQLYLNMFIPFILFFALVYYVSMQQTATISSYVADESAEVVNRLGQENIAEKARAVAREVQAYLKTYPLSERELIHRPDFIRISLQKLGMKGFTMLYKAGGNWDILVHPDSDFLAANGFSTASLAASHPDLYRILTNPDLEKNDSISKGFFPWKDSDGRIRNKYIVCVRVTDTPYIAACTTYKYEFSLPVTTLNTRVNKFKIRTRNVNIGLLGSAFFVFSLIIFFYGRNLSRRISRLSEVTDRISVGDLDIEIESKAKDEVSQLAASISRMQESIRMFIERMRQRK